MAYRKAMKNDSIVGFSPEENLKQIDLLSEGKLMTGRRRVGSLRFLPLNFQKRDNGMMIFEILDQNFQNVKDPTNPEKDLLLVFHSTFEVDHRYTHPKDDASMIYYSSGTDAEIRALVTQHGFTNDGTMFYRGPIRFPMFSATRLGSDGRTVVQVGVDGYLYQTTGTYMGFRDHVKYIYTRDNNDDKGFIEPATFVIPVHIDRRILGASLEKLPQEIRQIHQNKPLYQPNLPAERLLPDFMSYSGDDEYRKFQSDTVGEVARLKSRNVLVGFVDVAFDHVIVFDDGAQSIVTPFAFYAFFDGNQAFSQTGPMFVHEDLQGEFKYDADNWIEFPDPVGDIQTRSWSNSERLDNRLSTKRMRSNARMMWK